MANRGKNFFFTKKKNIHILLSRQKTGHCNNSKSIGAVSPCPNIFLRKNAKRLKETEKKIV